MVVSVPIELDMDHTALLTLAQKHGHIGMSSIKGELGWEAERADRAVQVLVREGMAWVDLQGPQGPQGEAEPLYWLPSAFAASVG